MAMEMEFDTNRAEVRPQYREELRKVANFMKANPRVTATVEGHTSNQQGIAPQQGVELSQRRAESVVNALVNEHRRRAQPACPRRASVRPGASPTTRASKDSRKTAGSTSSWTSPRASRLRFSTFTARPRKRPGFFLLKPTFGWACAGALNCAGQPPTMAHDHPQAFGGVPDSHDHRPRHLQRGGAARRAEAGAARRAHKHAHCRGPYRSQGRRRSRPADRCRVPGGYEDPAGVRFFAHDAHRHGTQLAARLGAAAGSADHAIQDALRAQLFLGAVELPRRGDRVQAAALRRGRNRRAGALRDAPPRRRAAHHRLRHGADARGVEGL